MRGLLAAVLLLAAPAATETPELRRACPEVTDAHCIVLRATLRDEKEWKDGLPPLTGLVAGRASDGKAAYLEPDAVVAEPGKVFRLLRDARRRRDAADEERRLAGFSAPAARAVNSAGAKLEKGGFDGAPTRMSRARSSDPLVRMVAMGELTALRDPALLPFFFEAQKAGDAYHVSRGRALGGIYDILGAAPLEQPGMQGHLSSLLTLPLEGKELERANRLTQRIFDDVNALTPARKEAFLAGFTEPEVLLRLLASGRTEDITEDTGLHSDTAKLIFKRFRELSTARRQTTEAVLRGLPPAARADALQRLGRFALLGAELEREEPLRAALPSFLFGRGSLVHPAAVFSIAARQSQGAGGAAFVNSVYEFALGADGADAAAYLHLRPDGLTPEQTARIRERVRTDARMAAYLSDDADTPVMYANWPQAPLRAKVVMTQLDHAKVFLTALGQLRFKPLPRGLKEGASAELSGELDGKPVSVDLQVLKSKGGWVGLSGQSDAALKEALSNPGYQVVVYRGHVGDYSPAVFLGGPYADKAFVDMSCDSHPQMEKVLTQFTRSAFFGTTTTAEGRNNNKFLPSILNVLAHRLSYTDMRRYFEARHPDLLDEYTGSWSPMRQWAFMAGRPMTKAR